jgi:hypothetical protein
MTHPHEGEVLKPLLREAESDLASRLEEACSMSDVSGETTGELMRLEETLLEAARAAKQAVSVRRRLSTMRGDQPRHADASSAAPTGDEPSSVRDFVDEHRVEWRVWEVIPSQMAGGTRSEHQLGAFQSGWLAFEAVGTGQRRRLRDYPRDWNKLSNDALEELLARAEVGRSAHRTPPTDQLNEPHG